MRIIQEATEERIIEWRGSSSYSSLYVRISQKGVKCLLLLEQASVLWAALKVMTAVFTISSPITSCTQQLLLLHAKVVHATRGI